MNGEIFQHIIEFTAFQDVFQKLKEADKETANSIEMSLLSVARRAHVVLSNPASTPEQCKIALLEQQIQMQAQSSQYLNISDQMTQRAEKLWRFTPTATEIFFDYIYRVMDEYFSAKKLLMYKEIENDGSWYSGLRDTAKKSGALVNWAVKGLNEASKTVTGKKLTVQEEIIDERSIVERVLEQHLDPHKVGRDMTAVLEKAAEIYKDAWLKEIKAQLPDMKRLSAFSLARGANSTMTIDFKIGATEQTLMVGIGSAVIGTLGLAAGWHTITYALATVFPPLAVFAVVATFALGFFTRDQVVKQRKSQVEEAVKQYHRYFMVQFDATPIKEIGNQTMRKHMNSMSERIVKETIEQWERSLFGSLKVEDYRLLNTAFSRHLLFIQEALDEI